MDLWVGGGGVGWRCRPPRSSPTFGTAMAYLLTVVQLEYAHVCFKVRVFFRFPDPLQCHISLTWIRDAFGPTQMGPNWSPHGSHIGAFINTFFYLESMKRDTTSTFVSSLLDSYFPRNHAEFFSEIMHSMCVEIIYGRRVV